MRPGPLTSAWFRAPGSAFLASWGCFLLPPWCAALVTSWLELERLVESVQKQSGEKPLWEQVRPSVLRFCRRATRVLTGDCTQPLSDASPGYPVCCQLGARRLACPHTGHLSSALGTGEASKIRGRRRLRPEETKATSQVWLLARSPKVPPAPGGRI